MTRRLLTAAAAAVLCAAGHAPAQQPAATPPAATPASAPTLKVGDKAPDLKIEKWIQGDPVTEFQTGHVYVVEFWATWCGPCKRSIPHLTELQEKYKDKNLTIIGISGPDRTGESIEKVEAFVKEWGPKMQYTVAFDQAERQTNTAYMKAAGQNGIPCAFVVDQKGTIAWIGNPLNKAFDTVIEQVIAGTFDAKAHAEQAARAAEADKALNAKMQGYLASLQAGKFDAAYATARELVNGPAKDNAFALNYIAWSIVDPAANVGTKDLEVASKAAARACELTNWKDAAILDTLARVHFCKGEVDKAIEVQKKAVAAATADERPELERALAEYESAKANRKG